MGVGRYVSVTRKITESMIILFSEKSRKFNTCTNSVYQAFPLSLERLGTRLVFVPKSKGAGVMIYNFPSEQDGYLRLTKNSQLDERNVHDSSNMPGDPLNMV